MKTIPFFGFGAHNAPPSEATLWLLAARVRARYGRPPRSGWEAVWRFLAAPRRRSDGGRAGWKPGELFELISALIRCRRAEIAAEVADMVYYAIQSPPGVRRLTQRLLRTIGFPWQLSLLLAEAKYTLRAAGVRRPEAEMDAMRKILSASGTGEISLTGFLPSEVYTPWGENRISLVLLTEARECTLAVKLPGGRLMNTAAVSILASPVQGFLGRTRRMGAVVRPRIVCKDGFSMSVQASRGHYCTPRNNLGPWVEVEVGFPSGIEPDLLPYAEDPENPLRTVYGRAPILVVDAVVARHGGIA